VELAYGLTGENVWHGTPLNPAAPGRFPGGSSCGSAAAVAAGLVDFALGSDTAGSVRVPASYCGLYGIRPSWGAVSLAGARGLAPSIDTAGWFARDAGRWPAWATRCCRGRRRRARAVAPPELRLANARPGHGGRRLAPALRALERLLGPALAVEVAPEGLPRLYEHARCLQARRSGPRSAAGSKAESRVRPRRRGTLRRRPRDGPREGRRRARLPPGLRARARALLAGGAVLAFPTAPGAGAPAHRHAGRAERGAGGTMGVTAVSGLAGLCEVTVPAGLAEGAPVGLSLVAAPGRDRAVLALAAALADAAGMPV
jgi:amidase